VKAAILLGQLIYWHGKQANPDGWIRKTVSEIDEETALSENEQETARRVLIAAGAVEFKRMGVPAMPYYRINHDAILDALTLKSAEQDSAKQPNQLGENHLSSQDVYRGNLIGGNQLSVQETTAESTTETTTGEEGAGAPPPDFDALTRAAGIHNQKPPRKRKSVQAPAQASITPDMLSHFAVSAHREIMGVLLDAFCMTQIIGKVSDEARWREVLTDWRLHPTWKRDNIAGQLDRYLNFDAAPKGAPALREAASSQLTGAARIAQETFDRQQRGMAMAREYMEQGGGHGDFWAN
jgi:hypothetical protein